MSDQSQFTHLDQRGNAKMVDVTDRSVTARTALASAKVVLSPLVISSLREGTTPKGDVLAVARVAAIMGAKRTAELIPLCHTIAIHGVEVELAIVDDGVEIKVRAKTAERTGIEMEAFVGASIAGLAIVDMVKSLDPYAVVTDIKLLEKSGGKNGNWRRE